MARAYIFFQCGPGTFNVNVTANAAATVSG